MKFIILLCDGMADLPIKELKGRTPLEVAEKPNMDHIAEKGRNGMLETMQDGLPLDSSVANLAILGYDPKKYFPGRGPLEAARHGIKLKEDDVALRCNLITEDKGLISDFTAGHITDGEARELMDDVSKAFGNDDVEFHSGVSYRNLLILRRRFSHELDCKLPHDIVGKPYPKNMVRPLTAEAKETADLLNDIMMESRNLLASSEVNQRRIGKGLKPANMLWFWGPGRKPDIPPFSSKYGIKGSLISAVDLLKGTAKIIGLDSIDVPGATGYLDTNYEGKADYALKSLKKNDFVFIHVESTDEAGHEGSFEKKINAIEDIDRRLLGRLLKGLEGDYSLGLLPDHPTPVSLRRHTADPVPFAIYRTDSEGDAVRKFTEAECAKGYYTKRKATEFIDLLLKG
ncbi:MAG: cofactor-independent phosphoglycerate mutase [Candidatus Altiarchaeota archaeon]